MPCTLAAIQEAACTSGIAKEQSKIKLLQLIAQLTCEASEAGGGGGSQTPWLSNIDGGGFDLSNVGSVDATTFNGALTGNVTGDLLGNVTGNLTGSVTGASSLNVLKAGDTMTGLLTIAQATANTSALAVTGYSLTGANAQSLLSLAGTWNTSGTPTAIDLNITDTASNANSLFFNLRKSGSSVFSVSKDGAVIITGLSGTLNVNSTIIGGTLVTGSGLYLTTFFDTALFRDAAGVIAQRNGVNAQTFRWYRTFTDASNYERGALQTAAGQVIVAAETAGTGTDDIDLTLTPAGAGNVRFGTHAGLAGESVTGFITIKDAAGNARKIAVVS